MTPDLEYTTDGFWITLYANTPEGVDAYNKIHNHSNGKPPITWLKSIKSQLKVAGITMHKLKPSKLTLEQVLSELQELEAEFNL